MGENNNGQVYLTRERVVELEAELRELKFHGRAEMAQKIFAGGNNKKEDRHIDARKALISVNLGMARKFGIAIDQKVIREIKVVR